MSYNLFLDDDPLRIPNELKWIKLPLVDWTFVRSCEQFVSIIEEKGLPKIVSFDHDLADEHYQEFFRTKVTHEGFRYDVVKERTGYHCAMWLAQLCVENKLPIPEYYIHTLNPVGRENIRSVLESAKKIINIKE